MCQVMVGLEGIKADPRMHAALTQSCEGVSDKLVIKAPEEEVLPALAFALPGIRPGRRKKCCSSRATYGVNGACNAR